VRQDPIFFRSDGARKGRDGCRIPIPWEKGPPGFGFTDGTPWLPVPESWAEKSVSAQQGDPASTLSLYRAALAARRETYALREGSFEWRDSPPGSLLFARDGAVACAINVAADPFDLPAGELLLASGPDVSDRLPPDRAAWVRLAP
jgi:alpha-glucosidase